VTLTNPLFILPLRIEGREVLIYAQKNKETIKIGAREKSTNCLVFAGACWVHFMSPWATK
jgi:hypothetical protein